MTLVTGAQLSRALQHETMCVCGAACAHGEVFCLQDERDEGVFVPLHNVELCPITFLSEITELTI